MNNNKMSIFIQLIAPLTTLVAAVWFVASIDKRIEQISDKIAVLQERLAEFKGYEDEKNAIQKRITDKQIEQNEKKINIIDERVNKIIYSNSHCDNKKGF